MFKEMRKAEKKLTDQEMLTILENAEYGVLSTVGEDGYPYGVPVNFVYKDGDIFFHCALEGHKLENISFNNKVSFCVTTDVELIPKQFNTKFKSVIAFGIAEEVTGQDKTDIFMLIIEKFSKEFLEAGKKYISAASDKAKIYKIKVQHISAKGKK